MPNDIRTLEREHAKNLKEIDRTRQKDKREAYLTPDMLMDREALTKGGRQKLALAYGTQGHQVNFSLSELNQMAKKIETRQGKLESSVKGVLVQDLVRISLPIDKQRAKDVRAATLFKFDGNTLSFRVTASGESAGAPSSYVVRVRLEEWHNRVKDSATGNSYLMAAQRASRGHVSFDCGCGRHQFWYRYVATIGNFALSPEEHVFPKIRNKRLRGACCKHTLKVLMTMQSPIIHGQIAKEMQTEATRKGFGLQKAKTIQPGKLQELEKAGDTKFKTALRQFQAKLRELGESPHQLKPRTVPQDVARKNRDLLIANLDRAMLKAVFVTKIGKEEAIKIFANENNMSVADVQKIGEEANIFRGL